MCLGGLPGAPFAPLAPDDVLLVAVSLTGRGWENRTFTPARRILAGRDE